MHEADSKLREENQALERLLEEKKAAMDDQVRAAEDKVAELQQTLLEVDPKGLQK